MTKMTKDLRTQGRIEAAALLALAAPALTAANVLPFSAAPAAGNQIGFNATALAVPN
jgi:hypothetical protein